MPYFAHEYQTKLPCSHNKSLPTLIRDIACGHCHGSCLRTPSSSSSDDDVDDCGLDFDTKQVILMEIRNRAMKAKLNPRDFAWSLPPPAHRGEVIPPKKKRLIGDDDEDDDEEESGDDEAYFSVRSCFSRCSSRSAGSMETSAAAAGKADRPRTLEELMSCEGWPFGLFRRAAAAAVTLPPLPSTPADSWMWHKRNLLHYTH
ncbi:uncharacterized protein LOC109704594 [Ananas comosus]|uniref:Uncharacterized protein LOC109704594 n=1 Tax=Ananas comosus TaxID=4615 RepID=A0A6P5EHK6_ANACO|nr:uncharacterized protein LOC109704594 [Ananas comosus]